MNCIYFAIYLVAKSRALAARMFPFDDYVLAASAKNKDSGSNETFTQVKLVQLYQDMNVDVLDMITSVRMYVSLLL